MNNISIFLLFNNRRKGTNFFFGLGRSLPHFLKETRRFNGC